ncbi:MAG TPA: hypothetical protein VJ790_00910, partial [Dongiaceae bacterium]|nr:hypothetical protein [Dongiaceae bacterium]
PLRAALIILLPFLADPVLGLPVFICRLPLQGRPLPPGYRFIPPARFVFDQSARSLTSVAAWYQDHETRQE